jgi:hypothetical protein
MDVCYVGGLAEYTPTPHSFRPKHHVRCINQGIQNVCAQCRPRVGVFVSANYPHAKPHLVSYFRIYRV